jgi:pSer/pThr/pTyr-binding forkhead associated (FHA) protein
MKPAESAYLRILRGRIDGFKETETIELKPDVTVIGRPPLTKESDYQDPDIKIMDDYVSKEHLKIYLNRDGDSYVVEERKRGTPNHTFINERQIEPGRPYSLRDGDEIGIARVRGEYRAVLMFRKTGENGMDTLTGDEEPEGLQMDLAARNVRIDGKDVKLRKKEFDLLAYLYQNRGKACSREDIAVNVWKGEEGEQDGIVSEETIDSTVHRLRLAIDPDIKNPKYIKNIRNFGFRLDLR